MLHIFVSVKYLMCVIVPVCLDFCINLLFSLSRLLFLLLSGVHVFIITLFHCVQRTFHVFVLVSSSALPANCLVVVKTIVYWNFFV